MGSASDSDQDDENENDEDFEFNDDELSNHHIGNLTDFQSSILSNIDNEEKEESIDIDCEYMAAQKQEKQFDLVKVEKILSAIEKKTEIIFAKMFDNEPNNNHNTNNGNDNGVDPESIQ